MGEQTTLFSLMGNPITPGSIVRSHGKELTWTDIESRIGLLVVVDRTVIRNERALEVVEIQQICLNKKKRKQVIYGNGSNIFGRVDKADLIRGTAPVHFFEV